MKKNSLIILVAIVILAAAGALAYFLLQKDSGPTEAEQMFLGKVVRISGSIEAEGLVQEYREREYIILKPLEGKNRSPVLYRLDGKFVMAIIASSADEYLQQKREEELRRLKEEEQKRLAAQEEVKLDQTDEQKRKDLADLAEAEKKKIREEEAQTMMGTGILHFVNDQLKEAIDYFYKASDLMPKDTRSHFFVGLVHLAWRDSYAAIRAFSSAIFNDPENYEAYLLRGLALATVNQASSAVDDLIKANNAVSIFARIPKRYLEEGVVNVPGGEIRTSSKQSFRKPEGKIVIGGKQEEYTPVEGGGFMTAVPKGSMDTRRLMQTFVSKTSEQDMWEIIHILIKSYRQQLIDEIEFQKKKAEKAKKKGTPSK